MIDIQSLNVKHRFGRSLLRTSGRFLYRLFTKITIAGLENVPASGPYLIAINHTTIFEPPIVVVHWPEPIEALGAMEMTREKDKSFLVNTYGFIPIDRDNYDRNALENVIIALRARRPVLIAPEGRLTFKPGMRRAKWGVAYLADKTNVPIVPVGITGAEQEFFKKVLALKRPIITMTIGEPFTLPSIGDLAMPKREALQHNADIVMSQVAAVLPPEYHGYYKNYKQFLLKTNSGKVK